MWRERAPSGRSASNAALFCRCRHIKSVNFFPGKSEATVSLQTLWRRDGGAGDASRDGTAGFNDRHLTMMAAMMAPVLRESGFDEEWKQGRVLELITVTGNR
ncbi:hypothetical protein EYF80_000194 [Liparis tanakae]|uniref:Uncharacterized protein n=1 Tax=Liparis tanakae TaxID=230148 RepID=A0A4Z2JI38_9TELE|nr:hypothetical protein EYF80_000194 [Liparis tanakae]